MSLINKDTKLFGSFSDNPGSRGSEFFNKQFAFHGINAIYKSFYSININSSLSAAKVLNFSGCAIGMPFKVKAYDFVNILDESAVVSGSVNTVLIAANGTTNGYNTDIFAATNAILKYKVISFSNVYVVGNGGLGKAVVAALQIKNIDVKKISRDNLFFLNGIEDSFVFNCTPVNVVIPEGNYLFDCRVTSSDGEFFRIEQARKQFEIYTGITI